MIRVYSTAIIRLQLHNVEGTATMNFVAVHLKVITSKQPIIISESKIYGFYLKIGVFQINTKVNISVKSSK